MVMVTLADHVLCAKGQNGKVYRISEPDIFRNLAPMHARLQREVTGGRAAPFTAFLLRDDEEARRLLEPVPVLFPHSPQRWRSMAAMGADIAETLGLAQDSSGLFHFEGDLVGPAHLTAVMVQRGCVARTPGGYQVVRLIVGELP